MMTEKREMKDTRIRVRDLILLRLNSASPIIMI